MRGEQFETLDPFDSSPSSRRAILPLLCLSLSNTQKQCRTILTIKKRNARINLIHQPQDHLFYLVVVFIFISIKRISDKENDE